jgi:uncharacterized protein (TIRG00374 family)
VKPRAAALSFALLTGAYVVAFGWLESRKGADGLGAFVRALPVLLALAASSWVLRFVRWQWLLRRSGSRPPVFAALLAYLAGFAFTATPGKVGELVRIRYFADLGVPSGKVLAAFIYERACDLVVVLLLAAAVFHDSPLFGIALAFVAAVLSVVALFAYRPSLLSLLLTRLQRARLRRSARLFRVVRDGLAGCRTWLNPKDIALSMALGLLAWSITSLTLVYLLHGSGVDVPGITAFGIYPLAMLAGAASMLPGGVGTTEAAIVTLLANAGVPWHAGAFVALGVRLATLWSAIAVGLLSLAYLEYSRLKALP